MPPTTRGGRTSKASSSTSTNIPAQAQAAVASAAANTTPVASGSKRSASKRSAQQTRTQSDDEAQMSTRERKRQRTDADEQQPLEVVVVRQPRAPRRSRSKNARDKRRARRALAASQATSTSSTADAQAVEQEVRPLSQEQPPVPDNTHLERVHKDVSPGISEMEAELAKLRRQLGEKEQVIDKQHAALTAVHSALQCQVCLDLLSRPFVLSKCGHVCCQGCLESWFTHSPQGDDGFEGAADRPLHARRKTCPHCRQPVRTRPIQLYLVKSLVGIMDAPDVLDRAKPCAGTRAPSAVPAAPADDDPFRAFFPPERARGVPLVDHEDGGILRCELCFHEVYGGACMACGHVYDHDALGEQWDESDGEAGDDGDDDSEGSLDEFIEYDGHYGGHPLGGLGHLFAAFMGHGPVDLMDDDEEDEDEDGHRALNGLYIHSEDEHDIHEVSDDEDDEDRFQEALETVEQLTEEEDEEEPVRRPVRARTAARAGNVIEISDDEGEETDLDEYHSRAAPARRVRRVVESDEEDEDGDGGGQSDGSLHGSLTDSDSDGSERGSSNGEEQYWSEDGSGGRVVREEESEEDEDQW